MSAKKKKKGICPSWVDRLMGRGRFDEYDRLEEIEEDIPEEEFYEEDDLFDEAELLDATGEEESLNKQGQDLQINLVDKGKALIAQAFVPGLADSDIDIDLTREMLTITTESNDSCVERDGDYLYEELFFGTFSRSILLPTEVEVEEAKAEVRDGILTIVMPKINKAARKKLSVKKSRGA